MFDFIVTPFAADVIAINIILKRPNRIIRFQKIKSFVNNNTFFFSSTIPFSLLMFSWWFRIIFQSYRIPISARKKNVVKILHEKKRKF